MNFRAVAVAQTCPSAGDVQANLAEHLRLAETAAAAGAQIVAFPELSLTGYELDRAADLAFSEADPRLAPLTGAAVSCGIVVVAGAPVRIGEKLHIGAFVLSPDGTTALYTKQRLGAFSPAAACDGTVPPPEAAFFHPGDRDPAIRIGGDTAALAVCADIGRAEHARRAAERGATAYVACMFVIPSEYEGDAAKLQTYAARHSMVVAMANFGCASGGLAAAGRSAVWSATGERLVQLPASGSGVAVAVDSGEGWRTRQILVPVPA